MHRFVAILPTLASIAVATSAWARTPNDMPAVDEVARQAVVKRCAEVYHASGHPCACPSDPMRDGQACGRRSAHDKPGGAAPVCSADEVTAALLASPVEVEDRCRYHGR